MANPAQLIKQVPQDELSEFGHALIAGLLARPRVVSPKYFYDAAGSALFDDICELDEYYPTRTELSILSEHAKDMAACIGPEAEIIEFGAGSSRKIRLLLDALEQPHSFVPIDISGEHLHAAARSLRADYPTLDVRPVVADFSRSFSLPSAPSASASASASGKRVGFFPGSSIGNFTPEEAVRFLRHAAGILKGGGLLIGIDLIKDPAMLHAAYNDAAGVTAAFNRNLLVRANRELGANFVPENFAHYAFYNAPLQRIEMHLISKIRQRVMLRGHRIDFEQGDSIHTENSYKFTIDGFRHLAATAGFRAGPVWCDTAQRFCLHWLDAPQ